ncbi:MAG: DUF4212 domain-containing protein [Thermoleophilia bacterium]
MEPERKEYGTEAGRRYWRANIRLIAILLVIWAVVSYLAAIILAEPFADITFFQIPLSFWFAQQGSIVVFVILIFVYARIMDGLDKEYDVHE